MIRLRLTMILWVSWISFFFFFLCHFNSFHTDSVTRKQKIILFFYQVFGAFIWILHSALIISLFFFLPAPLLFSSCFVCSVLVVAPPFAEYKGAIHRWDNKFVVSPFLFHVASDFSPFPFSLSLFSETWKFVRLPPSPLWSLPLSDVVFSFLTSFCQSSSVFPFKVTDMGGCVACFFAHHTVFLSSRLFQSVFFLLPLFSPSLFPCFCAEDENIGLVGCLLSSLWEFFLWFFATRCESDGSGQTNWPTAHC